MKKIIILVAALGVVGLGGTVLSKNISDINGNRVPAVAGSVTGHKLRKAELAIDGMWCASCATGAEYNLKAIAGVVDAYVGFTDDLAGTGWVVYEKDKVSKSQIIEAIKPYAATIVADSVYTE